MNLTGFRTEVAAKLSLNTSDSAELALIDQWINDGCAYVASEAKTSVAVATAAVAADDRDLEIDTDILRLLWIESSDGYELEVADATEIQQRRLNNPAADSVRLYALEGNMLMLFPTPSTALTLTIYYVPRPATLDDGADVPIEIPAEFHRIVTLYALWQGADYDDDQSSAQGARYKQLLDEQIAFMRGRLNRRRGRRLASARVSTRSRIPSRNDIA